MLLRAIAYTADGSEPSEVAILRIELRPYFPLAVEIQGSGSVTLNPPTGPYIAGTRVEATASPEDGWVFVRWAGDAEGAAKTLTITMDRAKTIRPTFAPSGFHRLRTAIVGNGEMVLDPLEALYHDSTVVSAIAVPAPGWQFLKWRGDASGSLPQISLRMDGNRELEADFGPTYSLKLFTLGGGMADAVGGADRYPSNRLVKVMAGALPGWTFLGWRGDISSTTLNADILMDGNKVAEAVFGGRIDVRTVGPGSVPVAPLALLYPYGTAIRLTAIPKPGAYWASWEGIEGTQNPLTILATNAITRASAIFLPLPEGRHALTVHSLGNGRVVVDPPGNQFPDGQSIVLTALANPGQEFLGWDELEPPNEASAHLTLTTSRVLRAHFSSNPILSVRRDEDPLVSDQTIELSIQGPLGEVYQIQRTQSFGDWADYREVTNTLNGIILRESPDQNPTNSLFRTVQDATLP